MATKATQPAITAAKATLTPEERAAARALRALRQTLKSLADAYRDAAADIGRGAIDSALTGIDLGDKYRALLETQMTRAFDDQGADSADDNGSDNA